MTHNNTALPRNLLPWLIWGVGTLFVVFQFLLQLSSGVMVERLMQDFAMTAFAAGLMSGAYYYIYVSLQTPAGMLIDRYGARKLLSLGGLICALGCLLFSQSNQVWVADLARVLMGGGSAFAYVGMIYLISKWFPARHFGLMLGLSDFFATIVTIGSNVLLATMLEKISWRTSMIGAGGIAFTIAILSYTIIPKTAAAESAAIAKRMSFSQQARAVMTKPILWLNGIYVGIIFAIVAVFSGMWGIPFIEVQAGVSNATATLMASMIYIGIAIACPIAGGLYPYIRKHLRAIYIVGPLLMCAMLCWIIYWPPQSFLIFSTIIILLGASSCVYVLCYTYVKDIVDDNVSSTAIGFTNALCVVTIPVLQPLVGYLLEFAHHRNTPGSAYTLADYQFALSVLPLSLVLASFLAWFIFRVPCADDVDLKSAALEID